MKIESYVAGLLFVLAAILFALGVVLPRARAELQGAACAAFAAGFAALAWP